MLPARRLTAASGTLGEMSSASAFALVLVLALAGRAAAEVGSVESPVLPPEAAQIVERAFRRLPSDLTLDRASISSDHVEAYVCAHVPRRSCFAVRLESPRAACPGEPIGPWCVVFPDGPPTVSALDALRAALVPERPEDVWRSPLQRGALPPPDPWHLRPPPARLAAEAFAVTAAPLAAGVALGTVLRRWRRKRTGPLIPLVGFALAASSAIAFSTRTFLLGWWDCFWLATWFATGLLAGGRALDRARWREWGLAAAATTIALLLVEAVSRWLLPVPPPFLQTEAPSALLPALRRTEGQLRFGDDSMKTVVCEGIYGDRYPAPPTMETPVLTPPGYRPPRSPGPRVLHLGDSMVYGLGLAREQALPSIIERLLPGTHHINGGIPGMTTDAYAALAPSWMAATPLAAAVVYVLPCNDLLDEDRAFPCAGAEPLLDRRFDPPRLRHAQPPRNLARTRTRLSWLLHHSGPPFPVSVATYFSAAARRIAIALFRLRAGESRPPFSEAAALGALQGDLRALRDTFSARGVHLAFVVLPCRDALYAAEAAAPARDLHGRIVDAARAVGVPTFDAGEPLLALARRTPEERFFVEPPPASFHYSATTIEELASWLAPRLHPLIAEAPTRNPW